MVLNGSVINLGAAVGAAVGGGLLALGGYTALGLGLPVFAFAAAGDGVVASSRWQEVSNA
jgi:predicted MFS family arabinose efflux permease